MTDVTMILRHLTFTSPVKQPATVEFQAGFNLIYGASNTGKSSILDAIDFMFGRASALKEIPEHSGYAEIFLGLEFSDGSLATIRRSIDGGDYDLFEGLHQAFPDDIDPITLKAKGSTKKYDSLSDYLMKKIGLYDKFLKRNARNQKERLTIRTLLPLFFVNETNIQKEISPFRTPQYTKETMEISRLKLLLTGVDDSALKDAEVSERETISRTARVSMLEEMIEELNTKIEDAFPNNETKMELEEQIDRLEGSIESFNAELAQAEQSYAELVAEKSKRQQDFYRDNERLAEIADMIGRFSLLLDHYESDLERLEGVIEAGSLFSVLTAASCPLCGASKDDQNTDHLCDANSDAVVEAAIAERQKITLLKRDLVATLSQLEDEHRTIESSLPKTRELLEISSGKVDDAKPELKQRRTTFADLYREQSSVEKAIELLDSLGDLEARLEEALNVPEKPETVAGNRVPTVALFDLAKCIKSVLNAWGLPNTDSVHFDPETTDIVLNGKHRVGNGKGHRSITHAAVTTGFANYLHDQNLPSLGFVVLDSPLLAYEEPDEIDEVTGTDLNQKCFDYLNILNSVQSLVFENRKSIPSNLEDYDSVTHFTKSETSGRYGFFPR